MFFHSGKHSFIPLPLLASSARTSDSLRRAFSSPGRCRLRAPTNFGLWGQPELEMPHFEEKVVLHMPDV